MSDTIENTNAPVPPVAPQGDEAPSIKRFFLLALLWLPLAFFLWYVLRNAVVAGPVQLAGYTLTHWMPELFARLPGCDAAEDLLRCHVVGQFYETFAYTALANVSGVAGLPGRVLEVQLQTNALMYCYGTAVYVGLVMATPLDWKRTFAQLGAGLLVLLPCQAFSLMGEALKSVAYDFAPAVASGVTDAGFPEAAAAAGAKAAAWAPTVLASHGLGASAVGLWYQFGYLILPPIVPVVLWILFNRRFIESLGARLAPNRGTAARRRGPTAP